MDRLPLYLLLILTIGCDGFTTLKGQIVDGDGKAISDAKIAIMQNGHRVGVEQTSKVDGSFSVGGTHAPSHGALDFRVRKEGFRDDIRRVPSESNGNMRVVLEREAHEDTDRDRP